MGDVVIGEGLSCSQRHRFTAFAQSKIGEPPVQDFFRVVHFTVSKEVNNCGDSHALSIPLRPRTHPAT